MRTKASPAGNPDDPIDISQLALAYHVSFLARGFPGKPNHLAHIIAEGIKHKGFALIHVLNPCPTFHDTWKEYTAKISEIGPEHDATDLEAAWKLVEREDRIPIGVILNQDRPTQQERVKIPPGSSSDIKSILASFR